MKAIVHSVSGDSSVLHEVTAPEPEPGPGEVRVRVAYSGVNPTDWKTRRGVPGRETMPDQIPDQDGAGVIDAVGEGVPKKRIGERVWLWEAAYQRRWGTAAEVTLALAEKTVALPKEVGLDVGAAIGVPAITAHRALTAGENVPDHLAPGSLAGRSVLVAGGAGAVGHAAIQLARWAGATVIATVSGTEKGRLATAAGAQHVVNYREPDAAGRIRAEAPDGVDVVVEVAPASNAELDAAVLAPHATVSVYAVDGDGSMTLPVSALTGLNVRWQFILVYTMPTDAKQRAVQDITAALTDGALPIGEDNGLPIRTFALAETGAAQDAVEEGYVGKVLVEIAGEDVAAGAGT